VILIHTSAFRDPVVSKIIPSIVNPEGWTMAKKSKKKKKT